MKNYQLNNRISKAFLLMLLLSSNLVHAAVQSRTASGCYNTAQGTSGETGAVLLTKVTNVFMRGSNNTIKIYSADGDYMMPNDPAPAQAWTKYRAGKQVFIQFKMNPTNANAKMLAQECLNNARIAMSTGMNLVLDGNFNFKAVTWEGCEIDAVDDGSGFDISQCSLQVANPADKTVQLLNP